MMFEIGREYVHYARIVLLLVNYEMFKLPVRKS
jgi:hypothetical protein